MTTSLAQENCSITLTSEQLNALSTSSLDTITLSSTSSTYCYSSATASTICFTGTGGTYYSTCPSTTIGTISIGGLWGSAEWVDSFPEWNRIEKMCKEYPALKLAFDKFKNTYNLVKDDYDSPPDKRIKP